MNAPVICAEGLGKLYRRGVTEDVGLRHALERFVKAPLAALRAKKQETFWALRDVSLEVKQGEVLGLIGRNGAGKTTLLKVLSRITKPTTGWAEIRGRVGSLLEVGTGFHPELTGRENAFLSGAILGMTKREIERKFDEIVAFAELEQFIDTPVKHYSTGMYVRLAFAVAAHLEPEILLVDEVLAVGDIRFQKKCLGKMGDVARAGRTVVLVSHQMNQIRRLCNRVIWVDEGEVRRNGDAHEVVCAYESRMAGGRTVDVQERERTSKARFLFWEIARPRCAEPHALNSLGEVTVKFVAKLSQPVKSAEHGVALFSTDRQLLWARAEQQLELDQGVHAFCHTFRSLPLRPGAYQWQVSLWDNGEMLDLWDAVPDLNIVTESHQHYSDEWNGILNLSANFALETAEERD